MSTDARRRSRNFVWRSLGGDRRALPPPPLFRQIVVSAATGCPRGPHTRPLSPWGNRPICLPGTPAGPCKWWFLIPSPPGGVSLVHTVPSWWIRSPVVLPSVVGGAAPVRRRGGVGLAGEDVPFPLPPSRRRCAGSGLAPGARGVRGEGVSSCHALVKGVVRVDRSCRRWVVFAWYYYPTRALRPW